MIPAPAVLAVVSIVVVTRVCALVRRLARLGVVHMLVVLGVHAIGRRLIAHLSMVVNGFHIPIPLA
jgi:hypothetical protein